MAEKYLSHLVCPASVELRTRIAELSSKLDVLRLRVDAIEGCIDRMCGMVQSAATDVQVVRSALREMSERISMNDTFLSDLDNRTVDEKMDEIDRIHSRTRPWIRKLPG